MAPRRARVPLDRYAALTPLPQAINELGEKLALAKSDIDRAVASSTAEVEEQKSRLSTLLRDLHEGVLVCNQHHQILLYNQSALTLLHLTGELGIGRSLLQVITKAPVLHTLERLTLRVKEGRHLTHPHGTAAQFVGATTDGRYLLEGRMSLILQEDDGINGYVVTFRGCHGRTGGARQARRRAARGHRGLPPADRQPARRSRDADRQSRSGFRIRAKPSSR